MRRWGGGVGGVSVRQHILVRPLLRRPSSPPLRQRFHNHAAGEERFRRRMEEESGGGFGSSTALLSRSNLRSQKSTAKQSPKPNPNLGFAGGGEEETIRDKLIELTYWSELG